VPAPAAGPGNWSGAASAVRVGDEIVLAYRVRRPLDEGRGVAVVVARSPDGLRFETVCEISREAFGAASLERPCPVPLEGGGWRLYLSCATPNSRHWWVDSLTAATLEELPAGERAVVLAGDDSVGLKDPVVRCAGGWWRMWATAHPLDLPGEEDRMTTRLFTSTDGLEWADEGVVLAPHPGGWDARGTRVAAVLGEDPLVLLYDGRPDAASNWFETTGAVVAVDGALTRVDGVRLVSPHSDGAFRYVTVVSEPAGGLRWYAEQARPDGAHDLVTGVFLPATGRPAMPDVTGGARLA
jgi:hypothetical protein